MSYVIKCRSHGLKSLSVPRCKGLRFKDTRLCLTREEAVTDLCSLLGLTVTSDLAKSCQETGNWESPFRSWNLWCQPVSFFSRDTGIQGSSHGKNLLLPLSPPQTQFYGFQTAKQPKDWSSQDTRQFLNKQLGVWNLRATGDSCYTHRLINDHRDQAFAILVTEISQ